ncbi:hypothetical protein SAMN05216548_10192 [Faunimonas pinastri]|uniref:DUF883 domain-containing protein n=1 Tax=Faunimonas pinastri TaxID=1855383 RepID=A0A1H8ZCF5_9HYPH|nr:hypothetical protein [Faunimonas pinastri]SEP61408.1 hypothetical protein SAMN05216548_10192 [Faunimonas pinastri]
MSETNLSGMAAQAGADDETQRKAEGLDSQISSLKSEIASLSSAFADFIKVGAREGRETLSRQTEYYVGEARALEEELETQISRNPLTAVLIALGLGFLIGLLARR